MWHLIGIGTLMICLVVGVITPYIACNGRSKDENTQFQTEPFLFGLFASFPFSRLAINDRFTTGTRRVPEAGFFESTWLHYLGEIPERCWLLQRVGSRMAEDQVIKQIEFGSKPLSGSKDQATVDDALIRISAA